MKRLWIVFLLLIMILIPSYSWAVCTTSWTRNKDWADKEALTDEALEGEFDRGYTFGSNCFNTSSGHDHDGTDSKQLTWTLVWASKPDVTNHVTVHGNRIANEGVHSGKIAVGAVGSLEIATGAIHSEEIVDGSIKAADIDTENAPSGQVLKSDGDGTASWAAAATVSAFVGTFTRDTTLASGTQAITGVGFTPKAVIFNSVEPNTNEVGLGFSDVTNDYSIGYDPTAGTWAQDPNSAILDITNADTTRYEGQVSSFDSDGFTITWTKTGSPSGTIDVQYTALR